MWPHLHGNGIPASISGTRTCCTTAQNRASLYVLQGLGRFLLPTRISSVLWIKRRLIQRKRDGPV
jgi:hypothetical protein